MDLTTVCCTKAIALLTHQGVLQSRGIGQTGGAVLEQRTVDADKII